MGLFSEIICSHYWVEVADTAKVKAKDTAVLLNYKDVTCKKCGKQARLTRQAYVQHLMETDRFKS